MAAAHRLNLPQLRREQQASGVRAPRTDLPPKSRLLAPIRACEAAEPRVLVDEAGAPSARRIRFFGVAELATICCTTPSPERRGQLQPELRQGLETVGWSRRGSHAA